MPAAAAVVMVPGLIKAATVIVFIIRFRYHRHMAMLPAGAPPATLQPAAALFRSLGDPARLAIIRRLADGEARVVDLTGQLGLAQSTVSGHLACLRDCGLVDSRPVGRASVFTLTQPALLEVLAAAEAVLGATGYAVALCPVYGTDTGG
jgi:ArsR family transcriptional regulator, cadmium/lead-responsive transcriptional repressor